MSSSQTWLPPRDPSQLPEYGHRLRQEARRLEREHPYWQPMGTVAQLQMLAYWRRHRPKMYAALQRERLAYRLAQLLENLSLLNQDQWDPRVRQDRLMYPEE